jgi:hypothetical protein
MSGGELFEDGSRDALQFPEARQIVLEFLIHGLRLLWPQLYPQDHVTEFHGVRQERVFLQFFQRGSGIVMIHGSPGKSDFHTHHTSAQDAGRANA